jgi:RNA polymerase sigma-70 factor (ECF subfamily)
MDDMEKPSVPDANEWLRSVVASYEGPLVRYAARITGDVERARDVVQDTFLRLCQQNQNELDGRLVEWLYTVCRRRALDIQRKEHRMRATLPEELDVCAADHTRDDCLEREETHEVVLAAISRLPESQQEVLRLKFQSGLSYREIAGVTGLSVTNVGYLLHIGLKTVREQLSGQSVDNKSE